MPAPPTLIDLATFQKLDLDAACAGVTTVDLHDLERAFGAARSRVERSGAADEQAAWLLLGAVCTMVLNPDDPGRIWGARAVGDGWRLPQPEDFAGAQSQVLSDLAPSVSHAGLRARLADVAWTNDKRLAGAAATAIAAYGECVDRLLDGRATPRFEPAGRLSAEALRHLHRLLQIAASTKKRRSPLPAEVVGRWRRYHQSALDDREIVAAVRSAELGLHYQIVDGLEIARNLEAVTTASPPEQYALARKAAWDLAAHLYEVAGDDAGEQRCRLQAIDCILAMRDEVQGAGAQAHWISVALLALRHVSGAEARRGDLRRELRDLQEDSLGELAAFRFPLDLGDERDAVLRAFDKFDLAEALRELSCISRSPPIAELRRDADAGRAQAPLSAMLPIKHSDADGKPSALTPAAGGEGEPDQAWYNARIGEAESFRRQIVIAGRFEPARIAISERFEIGERHLAPIVQRSPFVPPASEGLLTLGFARMLQGDYRSATHLVIPQLEPCMRYVLRNAGDDPVIAFDDLTEENIGLSAMLRRFRPQLEALFTADVVYGIELLFDDPAGPKLRHVVAHGALGAAGSMHFNAVYGCWLMYQLTCWPLLKHWSTHVRPAIEAGRP